MIAHTSPISCVTTSGPYIATAGYDNRVILWKDGASVARGFHDHLANQCTFNPSGALLASSSSDYTARIWSVPTMQLESVLTGHSDDVEGLAFHPSKPWIATTSRDKTVRIFELNGRQISVLTGHCADVLSVEWAHDGARLLTSGDDGTLRLWEPKTSRLLATIDFDGIETDTVAIANDETVFAGNDNGEIVVLKEREVVATVPAHRSGIKRLVYSSERRKLISLSYDRTFGVWEYDRTHRSLSRVFSDSIAHVVWPRSCAFFGENSIAFGTFGSSYATYDTVLRKWQLERVEATDGRNAVCVADDVAYSVGDAGVVYADSNKLVQLDSLCNFIHKCGEFLVCGGQDGTLYDAKTGRRYHQHHAPLNCACSISLPTGRHLFVGTYSGDAIVFRTSSETNGIEFVRTLKLHKNAIKGLAVSTSHLFSVSATSDAAFHSLETFECEKLVSG